MRKNKKRSSSRASEDSDVQGNPLGAYGFEFNGDQVIEEDLDEDGELYTRI